jgi:hypothetical protein
MRRGSGVGSLPATLPAGRRHASRYRLRSGHHLAGPPRGGPRLFVRERRVGIRRSTDPETDMENPDSRPRASRADDQRLSTRPPLDIAHGGMESVRFLEDAMDSTSRPKLSRLRLQSAPRSGRSPTIRAGGGHILSVVRLYGRAMDHRGVPFAIRQKRRGRHGSALRVVVSRGRRPTARGIFTQTVPGFGS